jgi:probable rRNA maturation factor
MWPGQEEIGEVLICREVAELQADENGWEIEQEIAFLLVHGILHVFGLDHELGEAAWKEQFDLHKLIMPQAQPMIEKLKKQTF